MRPSFSLLPGPQCAPLPPHTSNTLQYQPDKFEKGAILSTFGHFQDADRSPPGMTGALFDRTVWAYWDMYRTGELQYIWAYTFPEDGQLHGRGLAGGFGAAEAWCSKGLSKGSRGILVSQNAELRLLPALCFPCGKICSRLSIRIIFVHFCNCLFCVFPFFDTRQKWRIFSFTPQYSSKCLFLFTFQRINPWGDYLCNLPCHLCGA